MLVLHRLLLLCCLGTSLFVTRCLAGFVDPTGIPIHLPKVHRTNYPSSRPSSMLYYRDREESEEILTGNNNVATIPKESLVTKSGQSVVIAIDPNGTTQQHPWNKKIASISPKVVKVNKDKEDQKIKADNNELLLSSNDDKDGVAMQSIQNLLYSNIEILLLATAFVAGISFVTSVAGYHDNLFDLSFLHWNNNDFVGSAVTGESFHSLFDWQTSNTRIFEGIMAAAPMILLGNHVVEKSDRRDASYLNFSMSDMVMSLFGRRASMNSNSQASTPTTSTQQVVSLSLAISLCKALSEEIIFRGYLPAGIVMVSHSIPLALLTQAALFALGHTSPTKSSLEENKLTYAMQLFNGFWYGLVYLMAGGDILPCIIAHVLHDMHVFCGSWKIINDQMDYTEQAFEQSMEEHELELVQEKTGPAPMTTETLKFARRFFYAFDHEHKGSLSLFDVQRAVSYAFLQDNVKPTPEDTEEVFSQVLEDRNRHDDEQQRRRQEEGESPVSPNRLNVTEFLRVLFALKSSRGLVT